MTAKEICALMDEGIAAEKALRRALEDERATKQEVEAVSNIFVFAFLSESGGIKEFR
jgi:hypothetical protein